MSQNQKALHIVFPHQFLDSPEWFGVSTDDFFQVSIMAMEESELTKYLHVKALIMENHIVFSESIDMAQRQAEIEHYQ